MKQIKDVEKLWDWIMMNLGCDSVNIWSLKDKIDSLAVEVEPETTPINDAYMCCVCGNTPVDVVSGFDTCENCARKI